MVVSYLPWFEVFFRLLNYIADILKCCADENEQHDVESLLEHLMSADVSKPSQRVNVTLPSSGLVSLMLSCVCIRCDRLLMPSSHRRRRQDKCLVGICGVNWTGDKLRLVHKCVHTADKTGQNCSVSQYIEDYWKLSATVTNSVHTADKTRQDSLVLSVSAVWTSH